MASGGGIFRRAASALFGAGKATAVTTVPVAGAAALTTAAYAQGLAAEAATHLSGGLGHDLVTNVAQHTHLVDMAGDVANQMAHNPVLAIPAAGIAVAGATMQATTGSVFRTGLKGMGAKGAARRLNNATIATRGAVEGAMDAAGIGAQRVTDAINDVGERAAGAIGGAIENATGRVAGAASVGIMSAHALAGGGGQAAHEATQAVEHAAHVVRAEPIASKSLNPEELKASRKAALAAGGDSMAL